jgi:hypothetical protein
MKNVKFYQNYVTWELNQIKVINEQYYVFHKHVKLA